VTRKIQAPTTPRQKTKTLSRSSSTQTSNTTFEVHGRASTRDTAKTTRPTPKRADARTSRMKIIEVGEKTTKSSTGRIAHGQTESEPM
jgi:hypothetical protein